MVISDAGIGFSVGLFTLFAGTSIALTIADRNVWPVSSYNVFNFIPAGVQPDVEVVLMRGDGTAIAVPPGRALPIEFFNARGIIVQTYVRDDDPVRQVMLARVMLDQLNARPWRAFDETMEPARAAQDPPFTSLAIDVVARDFRSPGPAFGQAIDRQRLFQFHGGT